MDLAAWAEREKIARHPEDVQRAIDRWLEAVRTVTPFEVEYRLMRHLAVIQLRSREIQTFCRDYGRSVFNEQHRQTVRRDPVRFRHDNAVAVRVHHVSVNPTTARRAKLADVQFAR